MANASYDTLTIQINADSKQANSSIKALSNNLNKLNDTAKNLNTRRIGEIRGLLLHIAKIDFSNVSKGLQDIVSAFKSFQSQSFIKTVNSLDTTKFLQGMNYEKFAQFKPKVEKGSGIEAMLDHYKQLNDVLDKTQVKVEQIASTSEKAGDVGKKVIQEVSQQTEELDTAFTSFFKNVGKMFFRILKYRIVRKIIQAIYQAISQGVQNIIEFDEATKEAFDNIRASLGYLTDALGSMLAPLIQMLQPFISMVVDTVADLANYLGQIFAQINGQTQFAQATKDLEKYRNELKKTQTIGIDELNVLNQEQGGSFEMVGISEEQQNGIKEFLDNVGKLVKDIINDIMPLLEPIFELINNILLIVSSIINAIREPLNTILKSVVDVLITIVDNLNYFLTDIVAPIVNDLLFFIQPALELTAYIIKAILDTFNKIMSAIKWCIDLEKKMLEPFHGLILVLTAILKLISKLAQAISLISNPFNWGPDFMKKFNSDMGIATPQYATGGFPEDGFFMANHNELVGTFSNGKTAVANNQEITQGIYEAVKDAMRETKEQSLEIDVDGRQLAKVVTKRQKNAGLNALIGGNVNWGV